MVNFVNKQLIVSWWHSVDSYKSNQLHVPKTDKKKTPGFCWPSDTYLRPLHASLHEVGRGTLFNLAFVFNSDI